MLAALFAPALIAAAPAAASYRAVGTEPFWSLSIDERTITWRPADGRPLTVAKPRPIVGINGELYRTPAMTVDVTHVRCSDGMSDRAFRDTVRVRIGHRTLTGCGGEAVESGASLIADTRWTIAAVDGRPVRLSRPATLRFTADRIEGRICNAYGGSYRFARGTLTTGAIVATRMACADGAGMVESAVLAALARPLKVHRGNVDTLVLADTRRSVTLRRMR